MGTLVCPRPRLSNKFSLVVTTVRTNYKWPTSVFSPRENGPAYIVMFAPNLAPTGNGCVGALTHGPHAPFMHRLALPVYLQCESGKPALLPMSTMISGRPRFAEPIHRLIACNRLAPVKLCKVIFQLNHPPSILNHVRVHPAPQTSTGCKWRMPRDKSYRISPTPLRI